MKSVSLFRSSKSSCPFPSGIPNLRFGSPDLPLTDCFTWRVVSYNKQRLEWLWCYLNLAWLSKCLPRLYVHLDYAFTVCLQQEDYKFWWSIHNFKGSILSPLKRDRIIPTIYSNQRRLALIVRHRIPSNGRAGNQPILHSPPNILIQRTVFWGMAEHHIRLHFNHLHTPMFN